MRVKRNANTVSVKNVIDSLLINQEAFHPNYPAALNRLACSNWPGQDLHTGNMLPFGCDSSHSGKIQHPFSPKEKHFRIRYSFAPSFQLLARLLVCFFVFKLDRNTHSTTPGVPFSPLSPPRLSTLGDAHTNMRRIFIIQRAWTAAVWADAGLTCLCGTNSHMAELGFFKGSL